MKRIIILIISVLTIFVSRTQEKPIKNKLNHILSIGTTNSIIFSDFEDMNDWTGYSKRQVVPGFELGYLFSYQFKERINVKIGLNACSFIRNNFKYWGRNKLYSANNPNIPLLLEFNPIKKSSLFISTGVKISIEFYKNIFSSSYPATNTTPALIISEYTTSGINTMISFGVGNAKFIRNKYKIEWLLSYNHGTNSLRSYEFIRFEPYIVSKLKAYNSHLSFTLRYYFKKYQ
jgi:hypothetical protein